MTSMPRSPRIRRADTTRWPLAAVLGLLVCLPVITHAKSSDRQQPMHVDAEHFDGYQKPNSVSTLTGHVVITQGSLKATGALAKVYFDANSQINRIVITGSLAHIQQTDDNGNLMTGQADQLEYDNLKGIAILTGNAQMKQKGRGQAQGSRLVYNTQTSQMTGESGGSGRVHLTFEPKNASVAPAPATSAGKQP